MHVRECFLHLWELILAAILFVVLVRGLDQPLLIHQRIVVIVDPHHAIQCLDEGPIECRSQPFRFLLEGVRVLARSSDTPNRHIRSSQPAVHC